MLLYQAAVLPTPCPCTHAIIRCLWLIRLALGWQTMRQRTSRATCSAGRAALRRPRNPGQPVPAAYQLPHERRAVGAQPLAPASVHQASAAQQGRARLRTHLHTGNQNKACQGCCMPLRMAFWHRILGVICYDLNLSATGDTSARCERWAAEHSLCSFLQHGASCRVLQHGYGAPCTVGWGATSNVAMAAAVGWSKTSVAGRSCPVARASWLRSSRAPGVSQRQRSAC